RMNEMQYRRALIVGAGEGLSASVARLFAREGIGVALAARDPGKLEPLIRETGGEAFACDAADPAQVKQLFEVHERAFGNPDVVLYNASARSRGPLVSLDPAEVKRALEVGAFGGFLVAQEAARRMLKEGRGAI